MPLLLCHTHWTLAICRFAHSIQTVPFRYDALHSFQDLSNLKRHVYSIKRHTRGDLSRTLFDVSKLLRNNFYAPCGGVVALRRRGAAPAGDEVLRGHRGQQQRQLQHRGGRQPGHECAMSRVRSSRSALRVSHACHRETIPI